MERIQSPVKSKLKKEKAKKGQVTIRDKKNGKEARVTLQLNIPGVPNPRLEIYGSTEAVARKKLAQAILFKCIELQKSKNLADIQVFTPECQLELEKFNEYVECIRNYHLQPKDIDAKIVKYPISQYIEKMIKEKKNQSEKKYTKKRKKITKGTVTYYLRTANTHVYPMFGDLDASTITQDEIQEKFDELDYSNKYLKDIKLVLKLALDVAVKEKIRPDNPAEKVYIEGTSKSLGIEIEHLEQDRQEVWLDLFEKDKRQWAYLFEALLLTGARPEEGCRF